MEIFFFVGGLAVGLFFKYNLLRDTARKNAELDLRKEYLQEMEAMRKLYEKRLKRGLRSPLISATLESLPYTLTSFLVNNKLPLLPEI